MQPSQSYYDVASRVGCLDDAVTQNSSVFECLQRTDSAALQRANSYAGLASKYGQWAFIPVTDGTLIPARPSEQLLKSKTLSVNGERILAANNANEGTYFVRQDIATEAQFRAFVRYEYPLLSAENLTAVMRLYQIPAAYDASASASPRFDSNGLTPPFATTVSNVTVGWQQAANNLYAETTFVCPAYWLGQAYADRGRKAWRYQFSVPNALHGTDIPPLMTDPAVTRGTKEDTVFRTAFQTMWANFIVGGDPTLALNVTAAVGAFTNTTSDRIAAARLCRVAAPERHGLAASQSQRDKHALPCSVRRGRRAHLGGRPRRALCTVGGAGAVCPGITAVTWLLFCCFWAVAPNESSPAVPYILLIFSLSFHFVPFL